ncbi:DUF6518 family protein [Demequina soli]|uniref:DUF6518 family protein n=1 Tax=Demequina soli TaxID=1638987 RepID=UPI0007843A58|nr:DUF6518 family protein [Demequina soli]
MTPRTRALLAIIGCLGAGVAISYGQTFAPPGLHPLVNSGTPVVALAAAASLAAPRLRGAVTLGALAGPLAMAGYYGTALARGFGASAGYVVLWCTAGLVLGAAMGAATWVLRGRADAPAWVAGAAAGLLPGIAIGEAAHGLTRIADTTPAAYWWTQLAAGAALLVVLTARMRGAGAERAWAGAATALAAAAVYAAYGIA